MTKSLLVRERLEMQTRSLTHPPIATKVLFVLCAVWMITLPFGFRTRQSDATATKIHNRRADADGCGFDGNSDIYGLGIRVGIYAQTFASWIGSELARFETAELNLGTNLFMSSLLISLVWVSSRRSLHAIEAFMMLQMLLCSWFTGPGIRSKSSLMSPRRGIEGEALNKLLKFLTAAYNVWFWWRDIDRLAPTPCGTYIFFIVFKFDLYGPVRLAYKVLSVLAIILEGRRDILYLLGTTTAIRARHLYSSNVHCLIEKEALQRTAILESYELRKQSQTGTKQASATVICSAKTIPSVKRRWSLDALKQQSSLLPGISESEHLIASSQDQGAAEPSNQMNVLAILKADSFLENVMMTKSKISKDLVRRGFKLGGSEFNYLSFVVLNKTYWRSFCGVLALVFQHPKRIQSLIITMLAYKVVAPEDRIHDTCMICSATLQDPQFFEIDWEHLHLAAQLRATKATNKRLPIRICWSAAVGLFFCVIQILAVELTIVWNNISGIQDLSSVGQLIPFVVGTGGLVRMLYVEGKRSWRLKSLSADPSKEDERTADLWARAYYDWKEHHNKLGWCERKISVVQPV